MRSTLLIAVLGSLLAGQTGCEKTGGDLGRLQDEATESAKSYQARLDELGHRLDHLAAIDHKLTADHPSDPPTGHPLVEHRLFDTRTLIEQLTTKVKAALAGGITQQTNPRELIQLTDDLTEELRAGVVTINDELDQLGGWFALAEAQPHMPPAPME